MEGVTSEVVNGKILAHLRSFARSEAFLPRLIETFEEHGRKSLVEIDQAIQACDRPSLQAVAHRLKGSCLNVGAAAMVQLLVDLERREPDVLSFPQAQKSFDQLRQVFETTCICLREQIS